MQKKNEIHFKFSASQMYVLLFLFILDVAVYSIAAYVWASALIGR